MKYLSQSGGLFGFFENPEFIIKDKGTTYFIKKKNNLYSVEKGEKGEIKILENVTLNELLENDFWKNIAYIQQCTIFKTIKDNKNFSEIREVVTCNKNKPLTNSTPRMPESVKGMTLNNTLKLASSEANRLNSLLKKR